MKITDFNPIGCFVIAEDAVWEVTGFFDCAMYECVEYFCQIIIPETGTIRCTSVFEDYEEMLVMFPTREKAERALKNLRTGKLPSLIVHLTDCLDDELEVMC